MVTEKQLAANRANAQLSTGPRTPEGKAIASRNALKHGILARAVIPEALQAYESSDDFDALLTDLTQVLAPVDAMELLLVQQIAVTFWRLARLYRAEGGAIAQHQNATESDLARAAHWRALFPTSAPDTVGRLDAEARTLRAMLDDPEALHRLRAGNQALHAATDDQLRDLVRDRLTALEDRLAAHHDQRRTIEDAARSLPSVDTALKYARYETALQHQLDRALARLERLRHP